MLFAGTAVAVNFMLYLNFILVKWFQLKV